MTQKMMDLIHYLRMAQSINIREDPRMIIKGEISCVDAEKDIFPIQLYIHT
jgi:hypothetical protein